MAKKKNIELEILRAEVKDGMPVNEIKEPEIKKRGVKAGIKRGSYKKEKTVINNEKLVTHDEFLKGVEESVIKDEPKQETFNDNGDDKYKAFLNEYGDTSKNIISDELPNDDEQKTENKEFDFTDANKNNQSQNPLEKNKQNMSMLVNGYMLLALCDFIIPNALIYVWGMFDDTVKKIKAKDVKLDKDQKESLKESADYAARAIFERVNPLVVFGVGMAVMYGSNIQGALQDSKNERG